MNPAQAIAMTFGALRGNPLFEKLIQYGIIVGYIIVFLLVLLWNVILDWLGIDSWNAAIKKVASFPGRVVGFIGSVIIHIMIILPYKIFTRLIPGMFKAFLDAWRELKLPPLPNIRFPKLRLRK